jgi:pyruvate dehydrogenase E2 component (dihydrolipoamide acetyltransferase)
VPADADGVILKTLVEPGAVVQVGSPIALLGDPGELIADLKALLVELGAAPADGDVSRVFSSPLARRLARQDGLSIADLKGTGPGGRVVRRDIQQATHARATSHSDPARARQAGATSVAAPAAVAAFVDIPHTATHGHPTHGHPTHGHPTHADASRHRGSAD